MSDLISRQAVLDKFQALCDACGEGDKYNGVMCRACALDDGICIVEDIPSAEPEQKWIPVSEALPEDGERVLITHKGGVSFGWHNGAYWERGASTNHRPLQTVIAWKPLPEPYRGE